MIQRGEALTTLDDPPLKALYIYNADPVASTPDSAVNAPKRFTTSR